MRPIGLSLLSLGDLPDWRRPLEYDALLRADRCAFAWEWTRRHRPYRDAWERGDRSPAAARCFGLEQFEDPALTVPLARPIWSRSVDPSVITAIVQRFRGASTDRLDLLDLQPMLTLCIDENEDEHLLLCDGLHFLRIDVIEGTLIGCPAVLRYLLEGFDRLSGPMRSIERLARLSSTRRLSPLAKHSRRRSGRWIAELRAADAIRSGADHQEIARALYGLNVPASGWRSANEAYRSRVQRLARAARSRLSSPVNHCWFKLD